MNLVLEVQLLCLVRSPDLLSRPEERSRDRCYGSGLPPRSDDSQWRSTSV